MRIWVALCLLAGILEAGELRVGRAAVKITPPAGIPLAGYYSVRLAEGAHDDLWAKAVVLQAGQTRAALVSCDLISLDREIVERARKLIEESAGIPVAFVMIGATHSHTGPLMSLRFLNAADAGPRKLAEQFRTQLPGRIADAVKAALNTMPAKARRAVGKEESVSFYRRYLMKDGSVRFNPGKLNPDIVQPVGPIDPDLAVVRFDNVEDKPLALYVNFALHLDTVGGGHFSADYPYTLAKLMGKVYGPDMLTLFTTGAAGNINHIDVRSKDPQKGHEEARRIGTILAGETLKSMARLQPVPGLQVQAVSEILKLPIPRFDDKEVAAAKAAVKTFGQGEQRPFYDLVHAFKVLDVAERKGAPIEAEVQVISLGSELAWVGLPGEIFSELGIAIKKASPFPQTIIVELANGLVGYVPTKKGFTEGSYEAISARIAPGGGEAMAEAAIGLLARLHRTAR